LRAARGCVSDAAYACRFDIARHVAAVLRASFKAPDKMYLGVKWCAHTITHAHASVHFRK
jgi:hypothetical protein